MAISHIEYQGKSLKVIYFSAFYLYKQASRQEIKNRRYLSCHFWIYPCFSHKCCRATLNHELDFPLPWPSELREDDDINAWIYESNRDRPLADVLSDSREVFQQLVDAIEAFSDDELQDPQRIEWLEGEPLSGKFFFSHFHEEHEPDMRAWLDRVRKGS
jgi:hypothetical protein